MLDSDLAIIFDVSTKRLNERVRRNKERFPEDFMFRLSAEEYSSLRSQIATSKKGRGGRRFLPYAFTEHGAIMLASVLNTSQAIDASVYVVRAFVRMREVLLAHKAVAQKLEALERKTAGHDDDIKALVRAIRQLMVPVAPKKKRIGFDG